MSDDLGAIENGLTKKVGPLPAWAWGLTAAGSLFLFTRLRHRGTSAATASNSTGDTVAAPDLVGSYDSGSGGSGTYTSTGSAGATSSATGTTPAPQNDAQWAELAGDYLITNGAAVPTDVQNALANYLAGTPLSAKDQAYVNEALSLFGSPPEGVIASTQAVVPVTTSGGLMGGTTSTPVQQTPGTVTTGTALSGNPIVSSIVDSAGAVVPGVNPLSGVLAAPYVDSGGEGTVVSAVPDVGIGGALGNTTFTRDDGTQYQVGRKLGNGIIRFGG